MQYSGIGGLALGKAGKRYIDVRHEITVPPNRQFRAQFFCRRRFRTNDIFAQITLRARQRARRRQGIARWKRI